MLQGPIEGRILSFNDMVLIIISELFILISKLVSVELKRDAATTWLRSQECNGCRWCRTVLFGEHWGRSLSSCHCSYTCYCG